MTTIFMTWDSAIDPVFRAAYLDMTGETIQLFAPLNDSGDRYLAGSSRVEAAECDALAALFPGRFISGESGSACNWFAAPEIL